jgi:thiol-disulfide isomerase/thioredoxin
MLGRRTLALLATAGFALTLAPALQAQDMVRSATGQRKTDLDKMELQAFPADAWGKLAAWAQGEALTPAKLDGKPVLIMTWSSWHPASLKALATAQRMHDKHAKDGLIVVGVHGPQGWDKAEEIAKSRGVTFPLAHDDKGDFRKALKISTDPDYYVLDRAGHLRYAALTPGSVEAACDEVVKETKDQAGDVPRLRKERADKEAAASGRSVGIRQNIDLASLPPIPPGFNQPDESAYSPDLKWPKVDKELGKAFGLLDQQTEKPLYPKLNFAPEGFHPSKPEFAGRVTVIYIWNPDIYETFGGSPNVMDTMDQLQRRYPRDLAVIGALVPVKSIDPQRAQNNQQAEAEAEQWEKQYKKYRDFLTRRTYSHTLAADASGSSIGSLSNGQNAGRAFPIPGAMLVSTDGTIRWIGWIGGPDYKYALDQILATDPGVKARRAADEKFLERNR